MEPRYDHAQHEETMYQEWVAVDAFNPDSPVNKRLKKTGDVKPFAIIMPPPNANDPLHIGHAMFIAIEDLLVRFHRMCGDDTVWIPGTDHAGIETQYVFEKKLQKQGKSRFQYDRTTLYQMIWDYVQDNSGIAVDQMKKLGASADWSRFCFTLDPKTVDFVRETFYKLHRDNLIYRDLQLVNYCTKCGTSYSELEVKYVEQADPLYYIKYGPLVVATGRPETKFGDVALAVHPEDKRYQQYIGTEITFEDVLGPTTLPVIADEYVDPEFGTGVLKITPAHDPNDFMIGKKHRLPMQIAIDTRGKLTDVADRFAGMNVVDARKVVVVELQAKNLIDHIDEKYTHTVGSCYRCGKIIEPLPLPQFFLKVKGEQRSLVAAVEKALDNNQTTIHGAGREKILRNWLNQLQDWNISRQIAWGIRIPVWYKTDEMEEKITISFTAADQTHHAGLLSELLKQFSFKEIAAGLQNISAASEVPYEVTEIQPTSAGRWLPETDTFDTWFSSGQWPAVTLTTTQPGDFERFYPTQVMETGYDILPFWVMRMMLLCTYLTGQTPFSDVYLHGLIRDNKGQKMSKSKGNVVNPLDVVSTYGADALRFALIIRSTPGLDKSIGDPDFRAARNFTTKLWNAARFVLLQLEKNDNENNNRSSNATLGVTDATKDADTAFDQHLQDVIAEVTTLFDTLKPGLGVDRLYDEFWHWFCDEQIELHKQGHLSDQRLTRGLVAFLKMLHPVVPFITEVIWQELRQKQLIADSPLIVSPWPTPTT